MKITIRTSGGIGGFGLGPEAIEVVTERLPGDLAERARSALSPARLKALARAPGKPNAADMINYEITVEEGGRRERVSVREDQLSESVLELIDEIRAANG